LTETLDLWVSFALMARQRTGQTSRLSLFDPFSLVILPNAETPWHSAREFSAKKEELEILSNFQRNLFFSFNFYFRKVFKDQSNSFKSP